MDYQYPLLKRIFDHFYKSDKDLSDIYLVCCQHLLEPQAKMFELFIDLGFSPQKIIILGKAYSANVEIAKEITKKGLRVLTPKFSGISFDEEHQKNCKEILGLVPAEANVVILDDGAELIMTFAHDRRNVLFAVEQTSSGFRKLENNKTTFPVINVARSVTKLTQESPLVARLCFERIIKYLLEKGLEKPEVLVVGLGPIGESVREVFKQNDFIVHGFDTKLGHNDLLSFVIDKKPDVIIGATGVTIFSRDDIEKMNRSKPLYLISVSSSDREFPVVSFRKNAEIYDDVQYKNIVFVNNGFPITFKGNRNELLPLEIEKTVALLSGSILYGVEKGVVGGGVVDVPKSLEQLIN